MIFVQDSDFTLHVGDVRDVLRDFPAESVDCVVTSPPYWGLRDYGTGEWEGGDEGCDHSKWKGWHDPKKGEGPASQTYSQYRDVCGKCGATRIDRQLGLEPTPEEYVANMVDVFREVRRVLAKHGTCWVNLGDSYNGSSGNGGATAKQVTNTGSFHDGGTRLAPGLKPKDLGGIPWRVAFALQADGWYLRSDIIWSKPNPMPESVTDRPTKAHEYVFLLTKSPRYFFDQEAVREAADRAGETIKGDRAPGGLVNGGWLKGGIVAAARNIRSVWEIPTQPYPEAHFATYPEALVERCIKAGCPEQVCRVCGKPRERIVEAVYTPHGASAKSGGDYAGDRSSGDLEHGRFRPQEMPHGRATKDVVTRGFTDCGHSDYRPGIVLDPFLGSGTTAKVARRLGRHCVGIELNQTYAELAAKRLSQLSLLAETP